MPAVELDARRRSEPPPAPGSDREFILEVLRRQTNEIVGRFDHKIEELDRSHDVRLRALEKNAIEEGQSRVAVMELSANVRAMLERERLQDQDIGVLRDRLATALRPTVAAEAASEGMVAGHQAGRRVGRFWGGLGVALSVVAVACMQYCQEQIHNGVFSDPKTDPAMKK